MTGSSKYEISYTTAGVYKIKPKYIHKGKTAKSE
jgi:hypothetical protein